jgi:uncharacterized membrane protein YjdF
LGGNLYLGSLRLYDFYLLPSFFRYDNFVHAYGTFIGTLALYSLLNKAIEQEVRKRYWIFALLLVFTSIGLGTIVELVEFFAVLVFGVTEKVGDYFNNTLDLLFNTLGATLATIVLYFYHHRPDFIAKINGQNRKID